MTEINPDKQQFPNINQAMFNNSSKKINPPKIEQKPDEFVSDKNKYEYDEEVQAYEYTKSEDGKKLASRLKKMFNK